MTTDKTRNKEDESSKINDIEEPLLTQQNKGYSSKFSNNYPITTFEHNIFVTDPGLRTFSK